MSRLTCLLPRHCMCGKGERSSLMLAGLARDWKLGRGGESMQSPAPGFRDPQSSDVPPCQAH